MESIKKTLDKRWFHLRTTELKLISSYGNISGLLFRNARAKIGVMAWGKHHGLATSIRLQGGGQRGAEAGLTVKKEAPSVAANAKPLL